MLYSSGLHVWLISGLAGEATRYFLLATVPNDLSGNSIPMTCDP
ncbi:hypothetical protein Rhal01_02505 [Rubritalea halochordaticola]|uniref:Uncharacterized protein n=1 Tax=Rubritalea halochordaticola TaxID=714537 RepID=A0ABP9V4Q8_9BACT